MEDQSAPGSMYAGLVGASETSADWRWRLFYAVRAFALDNDVEPAIRLARAVVDDDAGKAQPVELQAASVALAAVGLTDGEQWVEANEILGKLGQRLGPVDHGWLLTHQAYVVLEQNDIGRARELAVEALRNLKSDPDDVSARAVSGAAARVLLSTTIWLSEPDPHDVSERREHELLLDTASSWWRDTEVAGALNAYDDATFKTWEANEDIAARLPQDSQHRLRGAWLQRRPDANPMWTDEGQAAVLALRALGSGLLAVGCHLEGDEPPAAVIVAAQDLGGHAGEGALTAVGCS
jgi:hypothetical protein